MPPPGRGRQLALAIDRGFEAVPFDVAGDAFCARFSPAERRPWGVTLTPPWVIGEMIELASALGPFGRVIDAGCGTARFALAAAQRFSGAQIIGVEKHPELARLARAALRPIAGAQVIEGDFRDACLPESSERTLFIGNPPYVRHHNLEACWKDWYRRGMAALGIRASALAGLHAHFLLRTLQLAHAGDAFCFVLPAEWLDTSYGSAMRELLVGPLGVREMRLADRGAAVFDDALVSSIIVAGRIGGEHARIALTQLPAASSTMTCSRARDELARLPRWSAAWNNDSPAKEGNVEVGEFFEVHRGQVTGNNRVWIHAPDRLPQLPAGVLRPAITRARELLDPPEAIVDDVARLKRVVEIPPDWEVQFDAEDSEQIRTFLHWARTQGAQDGYIARHRSTWFAVKLGEPAPIVMTYMARRPPRFVLNRAGAGLVNIAHGLYPRQPLAPEALLRMVIALNRAAARAGGRTYAGNLLKFEPSDAMRMRFDLQADAA